MHSVDDDAEAKRPTELILCEFFSKSFFSVGGDIAAQYT